MEEIHIEFVHGNQKVPFIQKLFDYQNDGKEGFIHFDGHYYEEDLDSEPKRLIMNISSRGQKGKWWVVDAYKREEIQDTSSYDTFKEEGEEMKVCYFPTMIQKLFFRVVKELEEGKDKIEEFEG